MIALTDNPIDWLYAAVLAVPLLMLGVSLLAVWIEDRASTTSGGRTTRASGVADGLPGSTSPNRDGDPPVASGQPSS